MKEVFAFLIRNWQIPAAVLLVFAMLMLAVNGAYAAGPDFTGNCNTITWEARPESEMVEGYNVYLNGGQPVVVSGTSIDCSQLTPVVGQNNVTISAFNMAGEGVLSDPVPFVILPPVPGKVQGVSVQ